MMFPIFIATSRKATSILSYLKTELTSLIINVSFSVFLDSWLITWMRLSTVTIMEFHNFFIIPSFIKNYLSCTKITLIHKEILIMNPHQIYENVFLSWGNLRWFQKILFSCFFKGALKMLLGNYANEVW